MPHTIALDSVLVQGVALVTAARETSDAILTAAVFTHVRELRAFVDVFAVDVTVTFGTKFLEGNRSWFGTRVASMTPRFSDGATADALQIVALHFLGADAVPVVKETRFLALVNTARSCVVQGQSWRTRAAEGSFRVDAYAAAFANARVEIAFVNICARFAVHLQLQMNEYLILSMW